MSKFYTDNASSIGNHGGQFQLNSPKQIIATAALVKSRLKNFSFKSFWKHQTCKILLESDAVCYWSYVNGQLPRGLLT